jgi:hypothetical protein
MRVKDLIKILQDVDQELEVVVDGYETGYDVLKQVYSVNVFKPENTNKAWYDGTYSELGLNDEHPVSFSTGKKILGEVIRVIYLPRNS